MRREFYSEVIERIAKAICRVDNKFAIYSQKSLDIVVEHCWRDYRHHAEQAYRELMAIDQERTQPRTL